MEKRKINIDKAQPSSAEINQYKNFDKLMSDFNAINSVSQASSTASTAESAGKVAVASKGVLSAGWLTGIISSVLVVTGVTYYVTQSNSETEAIVEDVVSPKIEVKNDVVTQVGSDAKFTVNDKEGVFQDVVAGKDTEISFEDGSTLLIPSENFAGINEGAKIFCEKKTSDDPSLRGKVVYSLYIEGENGEYTEFTANNVEVHLSQDKDVFINNAGDWILSEKSVQTKVVNKKIHQPVEADPEKYVFDLDVDLNDFPEFANYQGWLFQVEDTEGKFTSEHYEIVWSEARLTRIEEGKYQLSLAYKDQKIDLEVIPVLQGRRYKEAQKNYEAEVKEQEDLAATYEANLKVRKIKELQSLAL